jgi:hypothetical protein
MDEWALLLKLMTEPRPNRPERPIAPVAQLAAKEIAKPLSAADRKLLEDYAKALARCGTGRVVLDKDSGFYVPELDADCLTRNEAKAPPKTQKE